MALGWNIQDVYYWTVLRVRVLKDGVCNSAGRKIKTCDVDEVEKKRGAGTKIRGNEEKGKRREGDE